METAHASRGTDPVVRIAGAGISGLSAAIVLAKAGHRVVVHEARSHVGARFAGDVQGLENWSDPRDVIDELATLGLSTAFRKRPCRQGIAFDPAGRPNVVHGDVPLLYLVERGPAAGTVDRALLEQAVGLGVDVRFDDRVARLPPPALLATGPSAADVIAVGYHFTTAMPDGFWVILDDALAPRGYAYLCVMDGRGTLKSCMYEHFERASVCAERAVRAFERLVALDMRDPVPHGGVGNVCVPASAVDEGRLVVGERAGFQDALWGFGMRIAIRSGVLAATALIEDRDYDELWKREIGPALRASIVNRALYGMLGNAGYPGFLRWASATGVRRFLLATYRPGPAKRALARWGSTRFRSRRLETRCHEPGCECVARCRLTATG